MKPIRVKGPTEKPVTLADLKKVVVIDFDDDDALLQGFLDAAIEHFDGYAGIMGRCLINQDWRIFGYRWADTSVDLPFGDVSSVVVEYLDANGVKQTVPDDQYEVIEELLCSRFRFKSGFDRPSLKRDSFDAVQITMTTGYGGDASSVPESIKLAIKFLAAHWYDNRNAVQSGGISKMPFAVDALIAPHRRIHF